VSDDAVLIEPRLQRLPLSALALAILLHGLVGTGLWWIAPSTVEPPEEEPVMVLFDSSPSDAGLQAPERSGAPPASEAPTAQQQALAPSREPAASFPLFEFSIPPVAEPPPPPTSRDFRRPTVPPTRPAQRAPTLPRRPMAQQRPPTELPAMMPSPRPGPEPGDVLAGRGRQRNDYLSRVFRHLEPYRFNPRAANDGRLSGRVVTRVTLARDGRVLDVALATSSGAPALDAAEIAAIRKASPFPPLPGEMPGDPVILVLPINY
jgi:protein TonB